MFARILAFLFLFSNFFLNAQVRKAEYFLENANIHALCQDTNGIIWVGAAEGLFTYEGNVFKHFQVNPNNPYSIPENLVRGIVVDRSNRIWILYRSYISYFDYRLHRFHSAKLQHNNVSIEGLKLTSLQGRVTIIGKNNQILIEASVTLEDSILLKPISTEIFRNAGRINSVYQAKNNQRFYCTEQGLLLNNKAFQHPNIPSDFFKNAITCLEDSLGNFWISTRQGIARIHQNKTSIYFCKSGKSDELQFNFASNLTLSKTGEIIISTDGAGILQYNPLSDKLFTASWYTNSDVEPPIVSHVALVDKQNNLWNGFQGVTKISYACLEENFFEANTKSKTGWNTTSSVLCFEEDNEFLYFGTDGDGLFKLNKKTKRITSLLKRENQKFTVKALFLEGHILWIGTYLEGIIQLNLKTGATKHYTLPDPINNSVWQFYKDSKGRFWAAGFCQGLIYFDQENFKLFEPLNKKIYPLCVSDIEEDSKGNLWLATQGNGIIKIGINNTIQFFDTTGNGKIIQRNQYVIDLSVDVSDNVWAGTFEGLYKVNLQTGKLIPLNLSDELQTQKITAIVIGNNGDTYIGTQLGIVSFQEKKGATHLIGGREGLFTGGVNQSAIFKMKNGSIAVGGIKGFQILNESNLRPQVIRIPLLFEAIRTNLNTELDTYSSAEIPYEENSITFEFNGVDLDFWKELQFEYKLSGVDLTWIKAGNRRTVNYSNLSEGEYIFEVKTYLPGNAQTSTLQQYTFTILPPWYRSWWAYMLYAVLIAAVLYIFFHFWKRRIERNNEEKLRKLELEKREEIFQSKIKFFTEVSHELRTPLTLISAPLKKLSKDSVIEASVKSKLVKISNQADQLVLLVNELLDFRKVEAGKIVAEFQSHLLHPIILQLLNQFEDWKNERSISVEYINKNEDLKADIDRKKFERIMSNLMSNAFKYVNQGGKIEVELSQDENYFQLSIRNSGNPISKEDLPKLFEPFYSKSNGVYESSGIGLSLVKEFTELHQGSVKVESTKEKGTSFTIRLPLTQPLKISPPELLEEEITESVHSTSRSNILLVEDNEALRAFCKECLQDQYTIIEASNGKEAIKQLDLHEIDLIVSDIMMPEMDGFQLSKIIKSTLAFSHIPLLLLTAKVSEEDQIKGLSLGADDFIPKPFNETSLQLKIRNILRTRQSFISRYNPSVKEFNLVSTNPLDEKFLADMHQYLSNHFSDPEFRIEDLADELSISQSHLNKKCKKLTDRSPVELLFEYRMMKAKELIEANTLNVSEIAYEVGFSDPKYFSKRFKEYYNASPSSFKK